MTHTGPVRRQRLPLSAALLTTLLVAVLGLAACSGSSGGSARARPPVPEVPPAATAGTCGWRTSPPTTYQHVVWVVLENHSYEDLVGRRGSDVARRSPYLNRLVRSCGLATNAWSVTHPSLPNYLAMVSGSTGGVTTDCSASSCPQRRRTLFDQLTEAGGDWQALAESMPEACSLSDTGRYVARHNPPTYFPALRQDCGRWDLPMGTTTSGRLVRMVRNGALPTFLLVVPNQCHNTHDCPIADGDAWLSEIIPLLTGGQDYRAGSTAVFVTWDEGSGGSHGEPCGTTSSRSCHVVTAVVAPGTKPGTRSGLRFDHYSLLRTTEQMLGIGTPLGHAADPSTQSMRSAFGL